MACSTSQREEIGLVCSDGNYSVAHAQRRLPTGKGKKGIVIAIALVVCIAPSLLLIHEGAAPLRSTVSAYTPHAPISIDDNTDFHATAASEGWPGTGTLASPYMISDYEFAGSREGTAFYVGNSTVYFVLKDCYFHGYTQAVNLMMSSNARIENCTVEMCEYAMILYLSSATVANNTIRDCMYAVLEFLTAGTTYSGNVISDNMIGLGLMLCDGNVVSGNTFQRNMLGGVDLSDSHLTLLRNNVFLKDGIVINGDMVDAWNTHDIDTSNSVNGDPVLYLADDVGSTVGTDYGQVILANCVDTVIGSQDLENTSMGVLAGFCSGVTIQSSVLRDNYYGMKVDSSNNMTLKATSSINNTIGIAIEDSQDCSVSQTIFQSDVVGISTWFATGCKLSDNIIVSEDAAIDLSSSPGAILTNNKMSASGILIAGDLREDWNTHDIDTTNSVNSLPVIYLKNLVGALVPNGAGQVILANCAQMQVAGSYIDRATAAFQLGFTSGCRVTTLSASNCRYGVRLYESPGIQVDNAMLSDNDCGVYVEGSDLCTITTNWMTNCTYSAILLVDSAYQVLQLNTMTNCGIQIGSGMVDGWNTHTIDISNFVNGKSVYYRKDSTGLGVPGGYGQVILANCTSSVVGPQNIVNASAAIQLGFCIDITVNNLTASENIQGVLIEHSDNCDIKGPWLTHNTYGVYVEGGSFNTVTNGLFYMNDNYAVYLDMMTFGSLVTGNTIQYNNGAGDVYDPEHVQARDDGDTNLWNTTSGGNYWQDWLAPDGDGNGIVDVPYELDGFGSAKDLLPLTTPTQVIPEFTVLVPMVGAVALIVLLSGLAGSRGRRRD